MKKNKGFTLIEILVVIAIIAILASYAIPSYRDYVTKSKRADAQARILEIAGLYEKFYANTNQYPANLATLGLDANFLTWTEYAITGTGGAGWVITATAQNGQTDDSDCPTITFNQLGQKGPAATCWE